MNVYQCEQYSDEWWKLRRGVPTASEFGCILTAKTQKLSATADSYINRLIGDLLDIEYPRKDGVATAAMRRGTWMEPQARSYYELRQGVSVKQVGFVLSEDGHFGCSPDALVGEDGVLELKAPMPATQVEYLRAGTLPADYIAQCHGHLVVTGRAWCDFMSYCQGMPPLVVRVVPDGYTKALADALGQFWLNYQAALAAIKEMG